jgi:AraC family transcriptional regulator, regulatory protein of adaptative response / methylated-DNA-[protein]-cysteine methyltransferase
MKGRSTHVSQGDFIRVARAIQFMSQHHVEQPSLGRIAAATGISEYHFARLFRRWAGISPKQFLQRVSLESAKRSLKGDASVLEAALSGAGRLHDLFVVLEAVTPGEFKSRGRGMVFRFGTTATAFGAALICVTDKGIAFLGFADDGGNVDGWDEFRRHWEEASFRHDQAAAAKVGMQIWGTSPREREPLRLWVHGSNFQIQVWQALLRTARDLTVNYSDVAREIGRPSAARAVGGAVGANPVAWLIPCHHVLRANGALGGYRWGVERKRAMLAWELSQTVAAEA